MLVRILTDPLCMDPTATKKTTMLCEEWKALLALYPIASRYNIGNRFFLYVNGG